MDGKMELVITENKKLIDIQNDFQGLFPYLKLEFFDEIHKTKEASRKQNLIKADKTIRQAGSVKCNGIMYINGVTRVSELENNFQELFGLSVQIFRKSGKVWLQTTKTDNWTLDDQNSHGKELSQASTP